MKLSPSLLGFIRGLGYALVASICAYIVSNIGASGLVSGSTALLITGIAGAIEHALTTPQQ